MARTDLRELKMTNTKKEKSQKTPTKDLSTEKINTPKVPNAPNYPKDWGDLMLKSLNSQK